MKTKATGICNASFGELLQGVLPGEKKFLVNLPINLYSRVTVELFPPKYTLKKEIQFNESYQKYSKSYKLLKLILSDLGSHDDFLISVESQIPIGKGLSSSTADMVAAARAIASLKMITFRGDYLGEIISEIEPNDGLHYPGVSAYHHTTGQLIESVAWIPSWKILGIDLGGTFDTVSFNDQRMLIDQQEMHRYSMILSKMLNALKEKNATIVANLATVSAEMWQARNPKSKLTQILSLGEKTRALGLVNTHSGTYVGLIFEASRMDMKQIEGIISNALPTVLLRWFKTISIDHEWVK